MSLARRLIRLVYRLGLRRDYQKVDRLHYLKRLEKGKHSEDDRYFPERDAEQFRADAEVCITGEFLGRHVALLCDPRHHLERLFIRQGFAGHAVLDHMAAWTEPDTAVLDVGANVGVYCVPLAAARPDLLVHAFEPNRAVAEQLGRNGALNRLDNLLVNASALAEVAGEADFYQFDQDISVSSLSRHAAELHGKPRLDRVRVETIDGLFAASARRISFIKIDVQGAELRVLKGGEAVIAKHRPVILFEHEDSHFATLEIARAEKAALADMLSRHGYRSFYLTRYDGRLLFPLDWARPLHGDVIALPAGAAGRP